MKIQSQDQQPVITLESICTIATLTHDLKQLKSLINNGTLMNNHSRIEMHLNNISEMDTSYFQLLLSCKKSAQERNIEFVTTGMPEIVKQICDLYMTEL